MWLPSQAAEGVGLPAGDHWAELFSPIPHAPPPPRPKQDSSGHCPVGVGLPELRGLRDPPSPRVGGHP